MVIHDDPYPITLIHLDRWTRRPSVVPPQVYDLAGDQFLLHGLGNQVKFLRSAGHAPGKCRNVRRFHGNDPTAALASVAHVLHVHVFSAAFSARLRGRCKEARCGRQTGAQTKSISQEITSVLHGSSSSRHGGPNCPQNSMDIGSKRDARPSNRREVAAVAIPLLGGEEETQML